MNLGGWIFIGISWGLILATALFCFWRVFKNK